MLVITLRFDGSCRGNGTPTAVGGYGFTIAFSGHPSPVIADSGAVPAREGEPITNNVAEWAGLEAGLRCLLENGLAADRLMIVGDSMLVIKQLRGGWRCKKRHLALARDRCRKLLAKLLNLNRFTSWKAKWVPRNQNQEADALSRQPAAA